MNLGIKKKLGNDCIRAKSMEALKLIYLVMI